MKEKFLSVFFKKKKVFIISLIILVLLISICIIVFLNWKSDCYRIVEKISKNFEDSSIIEVDKIEEKYSYVRKYRVSGRKKSSLKRYSFFIEEYNTNEEAQLREQFIKNSYILSHEKIDGTLLELSSDRYDYFDGEENAIFVNGKYLIIIYSKYKDDFDKLIEEIKNGMENFNVSSSKKIDVNLVKNYYDGKLIEISNSLEEKLNSLILKSKDDINGKIEKLDDYLNEDCDEIYNSILKYEKYTELSEEVNLAKKIYIDITNKRQEKINEINNLILITEKSLNKDNYDSIKTQINELKSKYYDDYKTDWNNRLNVIEEKVFKKSCSSYSYKELLRNPEDNKGKNVYWFGKVLQVINGSYSTSLRVGVDCKKYSFSNDYYCDNTIYVIYYGDTRIIEDDMVKIYGLADGIQTYTSVIGASITLPRVYAKYIEIQ